MEFVKIMMNGKRSWERFDSIG